MDYSMETLCLMWLTNAETLTTGERAALFDVFGSAENIFRQPVERLRPLMSQKAFDALQKGRDKGLLAVPRALLPINGRVVVQGEPGYPARLTPLPQAPELLYVRGELDDRPAVAVVGSRHDTRYGRQMAFDIASGLARAGVTVVSGLARGIDTAAHRGALAGGGKTIAVLGGGFSNLYPPENKDLAEKIVQTGGALVTEYPPDATPLPFHFPLRNRIISGLSDGVLLIEAALKSGTLSTVNHALSQGRPVFALPGNVDAPGSALPLKLLKEGAVLCTGARDILDALSLPVPEDKAPPKDVDQAPPGDKVLEALDLEEKTFEELLSLTGLTPPALSSRLSMLELDGAVEKRAGRAYARTR